MPATTDQERFLDADFGRVAGHLDAEPLAGKRIFVTGGTGFFGLWLLTAFAYLVARGIHLEIFVLSRDPNRFLRRFPHFRNLGWLSFVTGDVTDYRWPSGSFDYFVHAATDTAAAAHRDPLAIFDTIVDGTRHTLDHAIAAEAKRFLLISSGAVYGEFPHDVSHMLESAPYACDSLLPCNTYGVAKRSAEHLCELYHRHFGLSTGIARCFAFVGAGLPLDGHFAIGNFIRDALYAKEITVGGDGTPVRSYLCAADLAVWLLKILGNGEPGGCYNVGSDCSVSVGQLAHLVRDLLAPGKLVSVCGKSDESSRRRHYVPSIDRARQHLELDVWTPLTSAIFQTARWAQEFDQCS